MLKFVAGGMTPPMPRLLLALLPAAMLAGTAAAGDFKYRELAIPQATVVASAINTQRDVAGSATFATGATDGAIFTSGGYITFTNREATDHTAAVGINATLTTLAQYIDNLGKQRGFVRNDRTGKITDILLHQSFGVTPVGLNDSGTVAGTYLRRKGATRAFMWTASAGAADLLPPGATASAAAAINTPGTIIGTYTDQTGAVHGFAYGAGAFTVVDVPDATATHPTAISPDGTISGDALVGGGDLSFTLVAGAYSTFTVPNAVSVHVLLGRADGYVIGNMTDAAGGVHAFIRSAGQFTNPAFPGAVATSFAAATVLGDVAGNWIDTAGASHAFVGTCAAADRPCTQ